MDFVPQPEEAKKFGTVKYFKWHIYKYPNVFLIAVGGVITSILFVRRVLTYNRRINDGTYVPNVIKNRYAVCRPDDWAAKTTLSRYKN